MAARDFTDIPRYNGFIIAVTLLADVCSRIGDAARAERLYQLLLPFAERNATGGQAGFAGPVARYLGLLAGTRGEWQAAAAHFEAARAAGARMASQPIVLQAHLDEAEMLARRDTHGDREQAVALLAEAEAIAGDLGLDRIVERIDARRAALGGAGMPLAEPHRAVNVRDGARLRREGDVWAFDFEQRSVRVRDSKGVRCLATLLGNPGIEIHAAELARDDGHPGARGDADATGLEMTERAGEDAGPLLDAEAKAAYRQRLEGLRDEVEEAESFNDPERAARAREEIRFVARELAGAVGLGGRDRRAASNVERARVSVTKAIRTAIKRVAEHDHALGHELEATIHTGTFCSYEPDPRNPLDWRVEGS